MNRMALIISNPGEGDDYCRGVEKDVSNYIRFLQEPYGGLWSPQNEIIHLDRPTISDVRDFILLANCSDYSLIVFTGHGGYSEESKSTMIKLNKNQPPMDSIEFRKSPEIYPLKRTIILDCCRVKSEELLMEAKLPKLAMARLAPNPENCLYHYNKCIEEHKPSLIVLYSCSINQESYDDEDQGGAYSYNLIKSAEDWVETQSKLSILSVSAAHKRAIPGVFRSTGDLQKPQNPRKFESRNGNYFPFAIFS